MNRLRRLFFLPRFLALLILVQAMIPLGYMPDLQALQKGEIKISLCTSQGPKIVIGEADQTQPAHPEKAKADLCPFGWAPHGAVLAFAPAIAVPFVFASEERVLLQEDVFAGHIFGPAQARAPPSFENA